MDHIAIMNLTFAAVSSCSKSIVHVKFISSDMLFQNSDEKGPAYYNISNLTTPGQ